MKKALTLLFFFLAAAALVFGIIFYFAGDAFRTLNDNRDGIAEGSEWIEKTFSLKGLTEYIAENPQHVSLASFNVANPDSGIYYRADVPRTLGSLQNLLLLVEYERQVENGDLDPKELVDPEDVIAYALPDLSETGNLEVIKSLTQRGNEQIEVDSLVYAMIENNDIVISDWLWFKLGEDNLDNLIDLLALKNTDTPLPLSGLYISLQPQILPFREGNISAVEFAQEYAKGTTWSVRVQEQFDEEQLGITFKEERDALERFPKTTAKEYAYLMSNIMNNRVVSPEVCDRIRDKMSWASKSKKVKASLSEYGAIYDNRMGLLSGVDYGTSIFDNHTSVQAMFFDSLQVGFYIHMSANHMQEDFQQRLIWDPALFETTLEAIQSKDE